MNNMKKLYDMYYKYESDRAHRENLHLIRPEQFDFEYNKMLQIFDQVCKVMEEYKERLVREVNQDGN